MFLRLKAFVITFSIIIAIWFIGKKTYRYFTYNLPPVVAMSNLEHNGFYNKELHCSIVSNIVSNSYAISYVRAFLDNKEIDLGRAGHVSSKHFEINLNIDTTHMTNGKHIFEVEAIDSSYHHNTSRSQWVFYIDNKPLRTVFIESSYKIYQGKTLHIKIQANKKLKSVDVNFLSNIYKCSPVNDFDTIYECFIPIDCEENPQETIATAIIEDPVKNSITSTVPVQVVQFTFKKQKGFVVSQEKLNNESEISTGHKVLEEALAQWVKESPKKKMWHGSFDMPVEVQRMATPFGEIRVTPERGRHLHRGVDLISRPRCSVWAAQTGKVIIKERFFLTGNTIVLDHGLGVFTLYGHLEEFADIQVGDIVKKGAPVGKLGMTGYATGYHLHWDLRINNISVDPVEWTETIY